jgi:DNA topoisomerase IB
VVAALKRRRGGSQLLAYRVRGDWEDVHAEDVNAYIKRNSDQTFTAKDFRTWNASVLAAVALAAHRERGVGKSARERVVSQSIKAVAAYLGNTPAVCRASYVDPRVIDRYHAGVTIAPALEKLPSNAPDLANPHIRKRVEEVVLELLADARSR